MFERLDYSIIGKNLENEIKFNFSRKLNLNKVREFGVLISKVEDSENLKNT